MRITAAALKAVRACYWSLTADVRAHLLRSLFTAAKSEQMGSLDIVSDSSASGSGAQSEDEALKRSKGPPLEWHLCGQRVCFANFAHLLSTTPRTILKSISGTPDHRRLRGPAAPSSQKLTCYFFFYELYQSARAPAGQIRAQLTTAAALRASWLHHLLCNQICHH